MVLEAVMLCIDNSEWSRNGDYTPTRFHAQVEALTVIGNAKLQGNPETSVGLLSMAGDRIQVQVSPSRNAGAIATALSKEVKIGGESNFLSGIRTAALALKNRQNRNQRQRIVAMVGSPVISHLRLPPGQNTSAAFAAETQRLVRLAKQLKKNSVAVDIINFGEENSANVECWEQFIAAVNANDNSHLVNVPIGPHHLADMILSSPVLSEPGSQRAAAGVVGGAGGLDEFGIDPEADPEMALAIRMSMEEERARQQRLAEQAAAESANAAASNSNSTPTTESSTAAATTSEPSPSTQPPSSDSSEPPSS